MAVPLETIAQTPAPPRSVELFGPFPPRRPGYRRLNIVVSTAAVAATVVLAPLTLVGLLVAGAGAASLEVLWPLHDRHRSRRAFITDLTHAVGNRYLVLPLIAALLAGLGTVTTRLVPTAAVEGLAAQPWWVQLAIVFALTDLFNYLAHRAMHEVPLLWRFHAVHHSSEHLDWLATSRVHPVDLALTITAASLPAYALGYAEQHPWLLTILFLYPFYAHANAGLSVPGLDRLIVSPAFHHWHHADETAAHNRNFGAILTIWDRLLRTAHRPGHWPNRYGAGDPDLDRANYAGHLLAPLTPRPGAARVDDRTRAGR
jgi:sterol desaturase/sphingolipid hydroxylase (fatty acid hydroxylase superfamily)